MANNKYNNTKKEDLDFNVEDLMNEDDDDDDDDEDNQELTDFYQQVGHVGSRQPNQYTSSVLTNTQPQEANKQIIASGQQLADVQQKNQQQQQLQAAETKKFNYLDNISDSSDDEKDHELFQSLISGSGISTKVGQNSSMEAYDKTSGQYASDKSQIDGNDPEDDSRLSKKTNEAKSGDIIEVVEKNEKMNEIGPEKLIEHASQLLSFDNKFYNVQKKLMLYQDYPEIAKKLHYVKDHAYSGIVSSMAMFQEYLFAGNSTGIIRVFDLKTQKEMKPLMDASLGQSKVTCMEIAEDGGFLMSGYKKGQVALWDLVKYKLLKIIPDLHQSEVVNCKIYYSNEEETLFAVSSEDNGSVNQVEFSRKSFIGGYSYTSQFLFKTRLKGTASISSHIKNELYPHKYCDNSSLVAFGSLNEIVVCSMRPIKEVLQITKPSFCKEKSLPYIDWGYGLTPGQREKTVPIMAFAWDKLIQLVYINEQTQTIQMDGFYYSDQEIQSIQFVGDSILFALINGKEVKILYTTKFYPGHYRFLENVKTDDLINNQFEKVISVTAHCELEKGQEIPDIKSTVLQCQSVMNFNQCVKKYKSNIFFMGNKNVVKGRLFSWKEYLEHIKFKDNYDWLTVLKVALEIYNGESKGYAKVPDEKEMREGILKSYMKDMIKDSVQTVIYKYNQKANKQEEQKASATTRGGEVEGFEADSIAIKVAIEFCLSINATFFLFTDIFQIFVENDLEKEFIQNLEPFVIAGQFRKEIIPELIIRKMIKHYEDKGNLKILEKIIQQLDFSDYSRKDELLVICQTHCMVSALLYLMTAHSEDELGCMQILNTMFKLMREARNQDYKKDDIYKLSEVGVEKKYDIEKSKAYIGYKLLWIMKMFLEGKSFPYGSLPTDKHRYHIFDIAHFVTTDEFISDLIAFDCDQFLKIIARLFYGTPFFFLHSQQSYFAKQQLKSPIMCLPPSEIIANFHKRCLGNEQNMDSFNRFLLQIQSMHNENNTGVNKNYPSIELDYNLIMQAVISEIKKKHGAIEEDMVINTLKTKKIEKQDIEKLLGQLDQCTQPLPNLRIYLVEKKKDFVQSFRLNLSNAVLRKSIFSWINSRLDDLETDGDSIKPFQELKAAIQVSMRDLISISVNDTITVIDRWFDDYYQEQLILEELADNEDIQYMYLKKFLKQNEEKIQKTINEAAYKTDQEEDAKKYIQYLVLHTQLLCKFDKLLVEEFVKKDYYPVNECLQICTKYDNQRGEAVLYERSGKYLTAVQTYLSIINNLDISLINQELTKIVKAGQAKQGTGGNSSTAAQSKAVNTNKWEFNKCAPYKYLNEFDILVVKATTIASERNKEISEEGWFAILEGLGDYMLQLNDRAKNVDKIDGAALDRMKDFVHQRKNAVLKLVPPNVPLQIIMERLNLDFRQIKKLYDFRIKAFKIEEKFTKMAKRIVVHDLNTVSALLRQLKDQGYLQSQQGRCSACGMQISLSIQKVPFRLYACGHSYHLSCLKDDYCPLCTKKSIQIESRNDLKKNKPESGSSQAEKEAARQAAFKEAAQTAIGLTSPDKANPAKTQGLYLRQLEVFDQQLDLSALKCTNFV